MCKYFVLYSRLNKSRILGVARYASVSELTHSKKYPRKFTQELQVRIIGDGNIEYLCEPLLKIRDKIMKVKLHKRIEEIETEIMVERHTLYLGIEIDTK